MKKSILIAAIIIGCIGVLYFSWLPDPNIGSKSYFPPAVGVWVNENWNLRTAVPFVLIAAIAELGLIKGNASGLKRLMVGAGLFLLLILAEVGQLFIANRHFDWGDILWGMIGTISGLTIGYLLKPLLKK